MKQATLLFAFAALSVVVVTVCGNDIAPTPVSKMTVSICNGRFQLAGTTSDRADVNENSTMATVKTGKPIEITFASDDYVYTVQQPDTNTSVVVLPGTRATMSITVESGHWPVTIVQGCGRLFGEHEEVLVLNAVR